MRINEKCYQQNYNSDNDIIELIKELGICLENDPDDKECKKGFNDGITKINFELLLGPAIFDYKKCIKDGIVKPHSAEQSTIYIIALTISSLFLATITIIAVIEIFNLLYYGKSILPQRLSVPEFTEE